MASLARSLVGLLVAASVATAGAYNSVIEKDVVIIGGGGSGAHAAFRLREDFGKSIILIEKEAILGGHVDSYVDSSSGKAYDYGVQSFIDVNGASDFVTKRLGVEIKVPGRESRLTRYVDFGTGKEVNYTGPAPAALSAALVKYAELCALYENMILPSLQDFPAPGDIPKDLLIPFGDFAKKHSVEAIVPMLFQTTGLGVGDVTRRTTLVVMQAFGGPMARSFLGQMASFAPASERNQDIYDAFAKKLGKDVLYSSTTSSGRLIKIKAKRLLLSIEPTKSNLAPFDLDKAENTVFSKLDYTRLYAGIVSNPSLPKNYSLTNLPEAAAPSNFLAFPDLPFLARFEWIGTGATDELFRIMVIGDRNFDGKDAKKLVQSSFDTLVKSGAVEASGSSKVKFVAFAQHGPMHMHTSVKEMRKGFIQDLYALQGRRSTWWTGGAWVANFQTHLWWFNDLLLPRVIEGL
ncbi:uncharacterized protein NECHADRAFT_44535 [Fusarium vanettenii 77-13-4]|uniref:Amine oxidase domain-containing protein n=1 Tax=Fusarium vanettenii (strain ATCC MYA-4622 / CBS 123669 / FGSC 9596 / NRRL 45880 / 77-13-4) TaxID=660122 RepID=C7ZQ45_FUSV7|nr:uncharacterized protein NECHADRAFT_44535 [Fusarium vanettenii 77-13-4]EEU33865.1 hypothetical protein NECHADRAFT_44535 [Fusarium vanettenii 77-13-4]